MSLTAATRLAAVSSAAIAAVSVCLGAASGAEAAEPAQVRAVEHSTAPADNDPGASVQWVPLGSLLFSDRAVKTNVSPVRWDR
ncbi:hypothetical protein OG497_24115 [Streptomyces sp. NBC_01242]|uniref:hypothetical protein n=1 Tax=unclassified Streptomyces TaxID=2593676 RepID=UPI002254E0FB|nr:MULTISPECIES: hypothetical protein [unclassified Streptomyces]MCX4797088.1 hypothetical protein [Streptomyces sp. NBC_01242]WSJ38388.1 hypothetical protein OG772_21845 [Streptomyces sp. NBC_01321]WSP55447.1 hypothetical protein OG306_14375 [Streptomyces sp. NBC_01241]